MGERRKMVDALDALKPSLYERLGQEKLVALAEAFYTRVYADDDEWFRGMFKVPMEEAVQNQYEFLVQRFGGPPIYSQRKGHPALRMRHANFRVNRQSAARWLKYMSMAMSDVGITKESLPEERAAMWGFFQYVADFLRNSADDPPPARSSSEEESDCVCSKSKAGCPMMRKMQEERKGAL